MSASVPANLSTATGKSLFIFGSVVTISDFCQPLAPVANYALVLSFLSLLIFTGIILFGKKRQRLEAGDANASTAYFTFTGFVTSLLIFACSTFLVFQQQKNPEVKDYGLIASNVPFLKNLQASVMNIEKTLVVIEKNTAETSENTGKTAAVLLSAENLAEAIKLGDVAVFETFVKEGKRFPSRAYADTLSKGEVPPEISLFVSKSSLVDNAALCDLQSQPIWDDDQSLIDFASTRNFGRRLSYALYAHCGEDFAAGLESRVSSLNEELATLNDEESKHAERVSTCAKTIAIEENYIALVQSATSLGKGFGVNKVLFDFKVNGESPKPITWDGQDIVVPAGQNLMLDDSWQVEDHVATRSMEAASGSYPYFAVSSEEIDQLAIRGCVLSLSDADVSSRIFDAEQRKEALTANIVTLREVKN